MNSVLETHSSETWRFKSSKKGVLVSVSVAARMERYHGRQGKPRSYFKCSNLQPCCRERRRVSTREGFPSKVFELCSGPWSVTALLLQGQVSPAKVLTVLLCSGSGQSGYSWALLGKNVTLHNKPHSRDLLGMENPGGWLPLC